MAETILFFIIKKKYLESDNLTELNMLFIVFIGYIDFINKNIVNSGNKTGNKICKPVSCKKIH